MQHGGTLPLSLLVLLAATSPAGSSDEDRWLAPLVVPPGFEISVFADDAQAHSIHSLTFDARGRCVVSGPGYVKILDDTDGDARADRVEVFAETGPWGLQGMLFVGHTLYGADEHGIARMRDDDGDGRADSIEPIGPRMRRGGEHGIHALQLGPDGLLYVMIGNGNHLAAEQITSDTSPVLAPRQGNIIRMTLDGEALDVVSTGLRNSYDMTFDSCGELFAVDSDNEAELGLPFYRYPRLVHAVAGADIGWRDPDHQLEDYYIDTVPPVGDMGRGSPAGVTIYDHDRFPRRYQGAILTADWSWSRLVAFLPSRRASTWTAPREDLVHTGESISQHEAGERDYATGFYPTDLEVAPDGSVYIALGGRDTLGVVYRLSYQGEERAGGSDTDVEDVEGTDDPVELALRLPQPAAAWSHARRVELRERAADGWAPGLRRAVLDPARSPRLRSRAMWFLLAERDAAALPAAFLQRVAAQDPPALRAFAADALRLHPRDEMPALLRSLMADRDAMVRRRAIEAWPAGRGDAATIAALVERLGDPDRLCRHAAARALEHIRPGRWRTAAASHPSTTVRLWASLVDVWREKAGLEPRAYIALLIDRLDESSGVEHGLETLRLAQLLIERGFVEPDALSDGDESFVGRLRRWLPAGDRRMNREIINLLVATGAPDARDALLRRLESSDPLIERLHALRMASRLEDWRGDPLRRVIREWVRRIRPLPEGGPRDATEGRARSVEESMYWPRFTRQDPLAAVDELLALGHFGDLLATPLRALSEEQFGGVWPKLRDSYVRFDDRVRRAVLERLAATGDAAHAAFVRAQFDDLVVRAAVLRALRRFGRAEDAELFLQALADDDVDVVEVAVAGIADGDIELTDKAYFALISQLSRAIGQRGRAGLREEIVELLRRRTRDAPPRAASGSAEDELAEARAWQDWFIARRPDYPERFGPLRDALRLSFDPRNTAGELLRRVDFAKGDVEAGRGQYTRLGCHNCHVHSGLGTALGPDLTGAGRRLARRDLMQAIVEPSRVVPPRYQTTLIALSDGSVVSGIITSESGGAVRVQTASAETIEIPPDRIVEQVPQETSMMPAGLLEPASERDIADLFAFLSSGTPVGE